MKLILAFPFTLVAAVFFFAPDLSPRGVLFGVSVPPDFRATAVGRRAITQFRAAILLAFLAGLLLTAPGDYRALLAPLLLCVAATAMFLWENRQLKPFKQLPPAVMPQLEFSTRPDQLPRSAWLSSLPFAALLSTGLYLHAHWNLIPQRFPIHWNAADVPNGWAERTTRGVYGPLLFGILLTLWFAIMNFMFWHGVRRSKYRTYLFHLTTAVECLLAYVFSLVGLTPLLHLSPQILTLSVLIPVAALLFFSIRGAMQMNAQPDSDAPPQNAWAGGAWYFNRKDPALAVPRRDGLGYAPNFAHPSVWFLFLAPALMLCVTFRWIF